MKLDGREVADYIKERHVGEVRRLRPTPKLAIVRQGASAATDMYLRVKQHYGADIGVRVETFTEAPEQLLDRINQLNDDPTITGINVELPFAEAPKLTEAALAAVVLPKDIEGLAPNSAFELPTVKGIQWLLAAYNVAVEGRIVVIGQGRLVGRPLADDWEHQGHEVLRYDEATTTNELEAAVRTAQIIVSATGTPGLIRSAWVQASAVVIDAGAGLANGRLAGDLESSLYERTDIKVTPNPGGVGPMTVAALFDNVLLAARRMV